MANLSSSLPSDYTAVHRLRGKMGEFNSSVTRVWPVFDCLFQRDPTGSTWLTSLLKLGSRADLVDQQIHSNPGSILPELARFDRTLSGPLKKVIGSARAEQIGRIRNAYEKEVPPSAAFLRWLLEHRKRLVWPIEAGKERLYGDSTQGKRKRLFAGDSAVSDEALKELSIGRVLGSRRKWWAFEGFTSADCCLETETLFLLIEGKRTEPVSDSTDWFPGRNQVIRNLEVAQALAAARKNFAVLLCAETSVELPEDVWPKSLPHFAAAEIEELKHHYLGCVTWSDIAQKLCPGLQLPDNLDEAISLCIGFRS